MAEVRGGPGCLSLATFVESILNNLACSYISHCVIQLSLYLFSEFQSLLHLPLRKISLQPNALLSCTEARYPPCGLLMSSVVCDWTTEFLTMFDGATVWQIKSVIKHCYNRILRNDYHLLIYLHSKGKCALQFGVWIFSKCILCNFTIMTKLDVHLLQIQYKSIVDRANQQYRYHTP